MRKEYDSEPATRNLQLESIAHITGQKEIKKTPGRVGSHIIHWEFLCTTHREFYRLLPEEFRIVTNPETGRQSVVIPGEFREESVRVGYHQQPEHGSLKAFLHRFGEFYKPAKHHGALKLVAAAVAHHRLMWIHPFLDGNGRVARLFTEACLHRIPIHGFGLWSVSRGLARGNVDYKSALSFADAPCRSDLDGRANLSNEGLVHFCRFFLEVCLDQLVKGKAVRRSVIAASGLKERRGKSLLGQLIEEGLPVSDTPKGDVHLGFPIHAAGWFFPDLYPTRSG